MVAYSALAAPTLEVEAASLAVWGASAIAAGEALLVPVACSGGAGEATEARTEVGKVGVRVLMVGVFGSTVAASGGRDDARGDAGISERSDGGSA